MIHHCHSTRSATCVHFLVRRTLTCQRSLPPSRTKVIRFQSVRGTQTTWARWSPFCGRTSVNRTGVTANRHRKCTALPSTSSRQSNSFGFHQALRERCDRVRCRVCTQYNRVTIDYNGLAYIGRDGLSARMRSNLPVALERGGKTYHHHLHCKVTTRRVTHKSGASKKHKSVHVVGMRCHVGSPAVKQFEVSLMSKPAVQRKVSTNRLALTIAASIDWPLKKRQPTRLWSNALFPMFSAPGITAWSIAGSIEPATKFC